MSNLVECEICGNNIFHYYERPYIVCGDCREKILKQFQEQVVEAYYATHKQEKSKDSKESEGGSRVPQVAQAYF